MDKKEIGRKSRSSGKRFEIMVRNNLESKGFVVVKWSNQVDLLKDKLVPAKSKYNPFLRRVMSEGSGLPDFLIYRDSVDRQRVIVGIESKIGKYLDAEEKKKFNWLLKHNIFSVIYIAYKSGRGKISYIKYNETKNQEKITSGKDEPATFMETDISPCTD